jgi:hypothetical protein
LTQLLDGTVQAEVEINERILRPKSFLQLFASHDLPGTLQEHRQYLKGLILKLDPQPGFSEFSGL